MKIGSLEISPSLLAINPHLRAVAPQTRRSRPSPTVGAPSVARSDGRFSVTIPGLALKVTLNSRLHWAKKGAAVAHQRAAVTAVLATHLPPELPCVVTITRVGPRQLDDDNATASCKAVRDSVARWLGVDDRDERVTWRVVQELGAYAVRIEVRA